MVGNPGTRERATEARGHVHNNRWSLGEVTIFTSAALREFPISVADALKSVHTALIINPLFIHAVPYNKNRPRREGEA